MLISDLNKKPVLSNTTYNPFTYYDRSKIARNPTLEAYIKEVSLVDPYTNTHISNKLLLMEYISNLTVLTSN